MIVSVEKMQGRRSVYSHRGMGDAPVQPTQPIMEVCITWDSACVQRNTDKSNAYQLAMQQWQADNNAYQCQQNIALRIATDSNYTSEMAARDQAACNGQYSQQGGAGVNTYIPASTSTPVSNFSTGNFSFTASRSGSNYYPGDTWIVNISNATPGGLVTVTSQGNTTPMGYIDANGNWGKTGIFSDSDIGIRWNEVWNVGSTTVGTVNFIVSQPTPTPVIPSSQSTGTTNQTPVSAPGSNVTPTNLTSFDLFGDTSTPITVGGVSVGEYTALGLIGALVIGFMFMKGRH